MFWNEITLPLAPDVLPTINFPVPKNTDSVNVKYGGDASFSSYDS